MKDDRNVREWLARELRPVPAPEGLWERIEPALGRTARHTVRTRRFQLTWAVASVACILLAPALWLTVDRSVPPISRTPANFQTVPDNDGLVSLAGYDATAERVGRFDGEPVKQVIFTGSDDTVALFVASPKVKLDAGVNRWAESNFEGVACKRPNCPRVRTMQFPCSKQNCVLVCKTCSEQSLRTLMAQVSARTPEFR